MTDAGAATPSVCRNCEAELAGAWCHRCGQREQSHARSLRQVLIEFVELLTHADGRLWRTLRRLAVEPGRLTRDYVEGRRAAEIPPLRLFFVALVFLFAISSLGGQGHVQVGTIDRTALSAWLRGAGLPAFATAWLQVHLERAAADPRAVLEVMREWSERFAVLMLPIATVSLCLIFIADRRHTPYDHAIFSLHSLSFSLSAIAIFAVLTDLIGDAAMAFLLVLPLHLFVHMRGLYGTRPIGTVIRMAILGLLSSAGAVVLALGLIVVGLQFADA